MDTLSNVVIGSNYSSLFSNGIYIDFREPNRLRFIAAGNDDVTIGRVTINLYVKHLNDLTSLSPTKMETFEQLVQADIAGFLANNLKYWDGWETVLASLDLKLSTLENEYSKRDNIIDKLESNFVSAGNEAIPLIIGTT
jgi:hypothetical protein